MTESTTMLCLGGFVFSISTAAYQELRRTHDWRWAAAERIGRPTARQSLGPGSEMISLSGVIYPHFALQRRGLEQLGELKELADRSSWNGEPLQLVDGHGYVWGKFVILSLSETQTVFFSDGTPRKIEFSLELASYGYTPEEVAALRGNGRMAAQPVVRS